MPNQDRFSVCQLEKAGATILAMADGHGAESCPRSGLGAKFAVDAALETVGSLVEACALAGGQRPSDAELAALPSLLCERWRQLVHQDLLQNPLAEEGTFSVVDRNRSEGDGAPREAAELAYGTTLIVIAATPDHLLIFQLGDGEVLLVPVAEERVIVPFPPEPDLFGNLTDSLCLPDAADRFRTCVWHLRERPLVLAIVTTDGYSNSFQTAADFLQVGTDLHSTIREFGLDAVRRDLPTWLAQASREGSGDDCTVAILWNQGEASNCAWLVPADTGADQEGACDV